MRRIYWDTMLFAYWFEDNEQFGPRIAEIYDAMLQRGDSLCSSLFVLSEILIGPIKLRDSDGIQAIENFFDSGLLDMLPYTRQAVGVFTALRATKSVKSLDAIHLAISATAGVDLFLTNDRRLHKIKLPGLPFIASLETDLY